MILTINKDKHQWISAVSAAFLIINSAVWPVSPAWADTPTRAEQLQPPPQPTTRPEPSPTQSPVPNILRTQSNPQSVTTQQALTPVSGTASQVASTTQTQTRRHSTGEHPSQSNIQPITGAISNISATRRADQIVFKASVSHIPANANVYVAFDSLGTYTEDGVQMAAVVDAFGFNFIASVSSSRARSYYHIEIRDANGNVLTRSATFPTPRSEPPQAPPPASTDITVGGLRATLRGQGAEQVLDFKAKVSWPSNVRLSDLKVVVKFVPRGREAIPADLEMHYMLGTIRAYNHTVTVRPPQTVRFYLGRDFYIEVRDKQGNVLARSETSKTPTASTGTNPPPTTGNTPTTRATDVVRFGTNDQCRNVDGYCLDSVFDHESLGGGQTIESSSLLPIPEDGVILRHQNGSPALTLAEVARRSLLLPQNAIGYRKIVDPSKKRTEYGVFFSSSSQQPSQPPLQTIPETGVWLNAPFEEATIRGVFAAKERVSLDRITLPQGLNWFQADGKNFLVYGVSQGNGQTVYRRVKVERSNTSNQFFLLYNGVETCSYNQATGICSVSPPPSQPRLNSP